jgi:hypothetical protein
MTKQYLLPYLVLRSFIGAPVPAIIEHSHDCSAGTTRSYTTASTRAGPLCTSIQRRLQACLQNILAL